MTGVINGAALGLIAGLGGPLLALVLVACVSELAARIKARHHH